MKKWLKRLCWTSLGLICLFAFLNDSESYIKQRVVRLRGGGGMCSGEQVRAPSGKDYILSAGHCRVFEKDGSIEIQMEDGRILQRRVIAEDSNSDLLLLEGMPGIEGLKISEGVARSEHIRTFTHGHNMDTFKTEGYTIQNVHIDVLLSLITSEEEIKNCSGNKFIIQSDMSGFFHGCFLSVNELVTSASIIPGSSGGVAVNDAGELIGVASSTDGHFGYFVLLSDIHRFLAAY